MSKRDTLLLLEDMFQSAQKIKKYTEGLDFNFKLKVYICKYMSGVKCVYGLSSNVNSIIKNE